MLPLHTPSSQEDSLHVRLPSVQNIPPLSSFSLDLEQYHFSLDSTTRHKLVNQKLKFNREKRNSHFLLLFFLVLTHKILLLMRKTSMTGFIRPSPLLDVLSMRNKCWFLLFLMDLRDMNCSYLSLLRKMKTVLSKKVFFLTLVRFTYKI